MGQANLPPPDRGVKGPTCTDVEGGAIEKPLLPTCPGLLTGDNGESCHARMGSTGLGTKSRPRAGHPGAQGATSVILLVDASAAVALLVRSEAGEPFGGF